MEGSATAAKNVISVETTVFRTNETLGTTSRNPTSPPTQTSAGLCELEPRTGVASNPTKKSPSSSKHASPIPCVCLGDEWRAVGRELLWNIFPTHWPPVNNFYHYKQTAAETTIVYKRPDEYCCTENHCHS